MTATLHCIRCSKKMHNYAGSSSWQPNDGLAFTTLGHYGSTYFDPMDGSTLEVCVCDRCLSVLEKGGLVRRVMKGDG